VSATVHELPARPTATVVPDHYLNAAELADYLGVCTRTISRMVREGCPSHSFGRRLRRFRLPEVEDWLERRAA
jgi:excisionase family DNA binding protein